ncbi:MAG: patatin-like phospholipase family protein [Ignavibacteria bacterium]
MKRNSVALVLGSGGARGLAHIGVIKALTKFNIPIDLVIGTSMGAFIGGFFCKGYSPDEMIKIALSIDKLFTLKMLIPTFPKFGIIDPEKIKYYLKQYLGDAKIEELDKPFFAVSTDLTTGREIIFNSKSLVDAIVSSVAVPGLIKPHYYQKRYFVDGGLVNPLPVSIAYKLKAKYIIAVNVAKSPIKIKRSYKRPDRFDVIIKKFKQSDFLTKISDILPDRILSNLLNEKQKEIEPEYPGMLQTLLQSFSIMENQLVNLYLSYYPPQMLINPPIQDFNMLEFYRSRELIEIGEKSTYSKITQIKKDLRKLQII